MEIRLIYYLIGNGFLHLGDLRACPESCSGGNDEDCDGAVGPCMMKMKMMAYAT